MYRHPPAPHSTATHRLCVAPMLDLTDRHCRYFLRQLSRRTRLYTEMITSGALLHADPARFLDFDAAEQPLALQLGGSEPEQLAACARLARDWGYDEVNLNVGCPSDRVQNGRFGACLMADPALVADCVAALRDGFGGLTTVKHRIGIDHQDSYEQLNRFVEQVAANGGDTFIVHARKAWLQGLSPKQNREVPPLRYDWVQRLKRDFPALHIVINGGINNLQQATEQTGTLDGVMMGRAIYHAPWLLAQADSQLFGTPDPITKRAEAVRAMYPYIEQQLAAGVSLHRITRHMLGLFLGVPGARAWRRYLSEHANRPGADLAVLERALALVSDQSSDQPGRTIG